MLDAVGRPDAAQRLYCAARLPPLQRLWDGHSAGTPFAAWLPSFYEQVGGQGAPAANGERPALSVVLQAAHLAAATLHAPTWRACRLPAAPQVVQALGGEAAWCAAALPGHGADLPLALLGALMSKIEKPYRQRLSLAMAAASGEACVVAHVVSGSLPCGTAAHLRATRLDLTASAPLPCPPQAQ